MAKRKKPEIIKQSDAAKIAGVGRQALSAAFRRGTFKYNFFTEDGQIDINHPDWQSYCDEKAEKGSRSGDKKKIVKATKQKGKTKSVKKQVEKKQTSYSRDHSLTGGYDPSMFVPTNPSQLKALTDIASKSLEMRIKLGEYIPREMADIYFDKIGKEINQFVYLGRAISKTVCEKLDRIGMEKEVEKIINKECKIIIERIKDACNKIKTK